MRTLGFSLIELLLVLSIIAIILGMAVPSYSQYTVAAKRTIVLTYLMRAMSQLEEFYAQNHSYVGATLETLAIPAIIDDNSYVIKLLTTTTNDFVLAAIPQGRQAAADLDCGTLTLNAQGSRNITGNAPVAQCWQL